MSAERSKFEWPPKPVLPAEVDAPPDGSDFWARGTQDAQTPRRTRTEKASIDIALAPLSTRRQVETVWFGLTKPTFAERAADEGWTPDLPDQFCPRCGSSVGVYEADLHGCRTCASMKLSWDRAIRLGEYRGLLREAIHELKFSGWRRVGLDMGRQLGHQIKPLLDDSARIVLVPVPTTLWRRLSRGVDHTLTLCRGVQEVLGAPIRPALSRRHRPSQVGLSPTDRKRNVAGTMHLRTDPALSGATLLVIDDVRTTGATMSEACKALRRGLKANHHEPAAIWACTIAVAAVDTP